MRIGFDAKRFFHNNTGLGNYSRDLIRILEKYHPKNQYFLYNPKPNKQRLQLLTNPTTQQRLPSRGWKKFKSIWRLLGQKEQIKSDEIDIFHGLSGELPLRLPKKVKTIVTIHDLIFVRYPHLYSFFDRKIHLWKFKYAAKKADMIVAISNQTKQDIIQYLKVEPAKIKIIYQGCSDVFKQNYSEADKQNVREKYRLPNNFVLNVGTIEKRKNALNIVKAVHSLDTCLVLVGKKTDYFKEISEYVHKHQLSDRVIHLQGVTQQELAIIYQLADVFVYPSIFEGFGIPIIEALFSKTPVITTHSGVFPEAGGKHSLYIDPSQPKQIAEAITQILTNPELRNQIISKGAEHALQFEDHVIANQYAQLYRDLYQIQS